MDKSTLTNALIHIRKIHFFLILFCFFVISAINLKPKINYEKAIQQLKNINTVLKLNNYELNPSYYIAASIARYPNPGFELGTGNREITSRGYRGYDLKIVNTLTEEQSKYSVKIDNYKISGPRFISQMTKVLSLNVAPGSACFRLSDNEYYKIKTIGQFIDFWNDLLYTTTFYPVTHESMLSINDSVVIKNNQLKGHFSLEEIKYITLSGQDIDNKSDTVTVLSINNLKKFLEKNRDNLPHEKLKLYIIVLNKFNKFSHFLLIETRDKKFSIAIPLVQNLNGIMNYMTNLSPLYEFIEIDLTKGDPETGKNYEQGINWKKITKEWSTDRFESVFPELFQTIKNFKSLNISESQNFIKKLAELDRRPLNFLGIYTSFEQVASASIVVIFLILLYFYEYLKTTLSLLQNLNNIENIWIGINDTKISKALLLLTCPVLVWITILSVIINFFKYLPLNLFQLLVLVFAFVSLVLSIFVTVESFKFSRTQNPEELNRKEE